MNKRALQYTVRNIPEDVNVILRQRARESGKSFNQVTLEALILGTGQTRRPTRDFSEIAVGLSDEEFAEMEDSIAQQRQIDPDSWK
jgi:plasmid stability protein